MKKDKSKLKIRKANEKDLLAIFSLIKELAAFEHSSECVTNSLAQMRKEKKFFKGFVAETTEKEVVGMAIYFFAYYTWVGRSLYLDDLYVKKPFRGQGIGTDLLKKVIETARKEDCKFMRWQVKDWNKDAIEMYKKFGAKIRGDNLNCDLEHEDIKNFNLWKKD